MTGAEVDIENFCSRSS